MQHLYDTAAIRRIEKAALVTEEHFALMQRAGQSVGKHAQAMLDGDKQRPLLILAGPGNNGGDAFVAAHCLQNAGWHVHVVFVGAESHLPAAAQAALQQWRAGGGTIHNALVAADYALAIDGLLGIGISRDTDGTIAELIRQIRPYRTLAIDVPSGIDSDSGCGRGEFVRAAQTLTFFAASPGLYTGDGAAAAGQIIVDNLQIHSDLPPSGLLIDSAAGLNLHKLRRDKNAHKGDCGTAAIVGGDSGMLGALILATRAAVGLGAGKVFALSVQPPPAADFICPQIMWKNATDVLQFADADCLAIGPGLGIHNAEVLHSVAEVAAPLVVDADALTILAADSTLAMRFAGRESATIITPHAAEAARLLKCTAREIHENRLAAADALANKLNAIVVLKGAGTVVADKSRWAIVHAGNPGLAQAGAGDVLCGMITALLAQTGDAILAAYGGVWLHGAAADELAEGDIGLELTALPAVAAKILNKSAQLSPAPPPKSTNKP